MQGAIVVADKSKTVRRMVEIALAKQPFTLELCEDGQAALAAINAKSAQIAIVDADLPGIDGYTLAQQATGTKVILLVGRSKQFDATRGGAAHAHVSKPFVTQKLIEAVFGALGQEAPDAYLFRSTTLNIPLKSGGTASASKPAFGGGGASLNLMGPPSSAGIGALGSKPASGRPGAMPPLRGARPGGLGGSKPPLPSLGAKKPAAAGLGGSKPPLPPMRGAPSAPPKTTPKAPSLPPAAPPKAPSLPPMTPKAPSLPPAAPPKAPSLPPMAPKAPKAPSLPPMAPKAPSLPPMAPKAPSLPPMAPPAAPSMAPPMEPAAPSMAPPMEPAAPPMAPPMAPAAPAAPAVQPPAAALNGPLDLPGVVNAATEQLSAQVNGLDRAAVEQIAWEIIPKLAETLLKEEIARVVRERIAAAR